jgi:cytidylate kinase
MVELSRKLIEEAANIGNCIIVGRGAQCILQGRPDAFHVFIIYAPMDERLRRIRERYGSARATPDAVRANDRDRAAYVKHHYGCESHPHLYHAMFSSMVGEDAVVEAILRAMGIEEGKLARNARADAI